MAYLDRAEAAIVGQTAHISVWESRSSALAGISHVTLPDPKGMMACEDVAAVLERGSAARPRLLCLENTHNIAGGTVIDRPSLDRYCEIAHAHGARVHVDGARIFNAALALGIDAKKLVENADSVMFCLSKGLSAPLGSVLVGPEDFIERARNARNMLGGGMRQAGYVAAAGVVALRTTVERLVEDHEKNQLICRRAAEIQELGVRPEDFPTNIFIFSLAPLGVSAQDFYERMADCGVLVDAVGFQARTVTHRCVTMEQCDQAAGVLVDVLKDCLARGGTGN
jgi:threonine aldolase